MMDKKDLQKTIAKIREIDGLYAKAMMTNQQQAKNTATVNCGRRDDAKNKAEAIMTHPEFKNLIERSEATAEIEINGDGCSQIRIRY